MHLDKVRIVSFGIQNCVHDALVAKDPVNVFESKAWVISATKLAEKH